MRAIAVAVTASVALVVTYLALGGASYEPASVADPCAPRDWRAPQGLEAAVEQVVLSALDGAACELHVSREEIVLAFASRASLDEFAREHDVSAERLERLVRAGLVRAVDDAEAADAINGTVADVLRTIGRRVPVDEILALVERLGLA